VIIFNNRQKTTFSVRLIKKIELTFITMKKKGGSKKTIATKGSKSLVNLSCKAKKGVNIMDLFPDDAEAIASSRIIEDNLNGC
jgi:hypothetical protein